MVRRIGKVNYEIHMPDKGGRIHVNQLSRWKERPCQVNSVIEDGEEIEEYQWTNRRQDVQFGAQLPEDKIERKQHLSALRDFINLQ